MAVPDYQSLMLPLLEALADGRDHDVKELRDSIAKRLRISDEDREELQPSGKQLTYDNRLGWAKTYLGKAGLVQSVRRGVYQMTSAGCDVLKSKPARIDVAFLSQFPEFEEFRRRPDQEDDDPAAHAKPAVPTSMTPQEALDAAYQRLRRGLEADLLAAVKQSSSRFFERLVVELLVKMGYGGTLKDAGKAMRGTGDDGIDGTIKEDYLGLDTIYVQAKRWTEKTVGRPEVQGFAGSMEGVRGRKGVFITTSTFSAEAKEYVTRIERKIVLIDGAQLASLMIDFGIGVSSVNTYDVKRVDTDYFSEE